MNILVSVEELRIGGAQTFALRLAQALHDAGHKVYLYNMYWQLTEYDLVKGLASDVELIQYQPQYKSLDTFRMRLSGWFQRRGYKVDLRTRNLQSHLRKFIREKAIDVVHSHTVKCDHLLAQTLRYVPKVPLVVTMHGDYEAFLEFYRLKEEYVIPGYPQLLKDILVRLNGIAYLSEANLKVLSLGLAPVEHIKVHQIYNGLAAKYSENRVNYTRRKLNIEPEALVFAMVARGVPEKGWMPVLQAFQRLHQETERPTHLLLIGESPFLRQLSDTYRADKSIHFLGFVDNPVDCVATCDVGILASSLSESLPNSIAEYLFCGKAVISTNVGEISNMIRADNGEDAGLLIDFPSKGLADADQLYYSMRRYTTEEQLLSQHQALAASAFSKFEMSRCIAAYEKLYQECLITKIS